GSGEVSRDSVPARLARSAGTPAERVVAARNNLASQVGSHVDRGSVQVGAGPFRSLVTSDDGATAQPLVRVAILADAYIRRSSIAVTVCTLEPSRLDLAGEAHARNAQLFACSGE